MGSVLLARLDPTICSKRWDTLAADVSLPDLLSITHFSRTTIWTRWYTVHPTVSPESRYHSRKCIAYMLTACLGTNTKSNWTERSASRHFLKVASGNLLSTSRAHAFNAPE